MNSKKFLKTQLYYFKQNIISLRTTLINIVSVILKKLGVFHHFLVSFHPSLPLRQTLLYVQPVFVKHGQVLVQTTDCLFVLCVPFSYNCLAVWIITDITKEKKKVWFKQNILTIFFVKQLKFVLKTFIRVDKVTIQNLACPMYIFSVWLI